MATFCFILALLGGGLFVAIRRQLFSELDSSLRTAAAELERAARIREMEAGASGNVVDAVDELHIPDRALYLLDASGQPVKPVSVPAWLHDVAQRAAHEGRVDFDHSLPGDRTLRVYGERFALTGGRAMVAMAVADKVELAHRYASLIAAFGAAAFAALILVAGGAWLLVRKSTAPIERSIEQMRRFMADAAHELRTPLTVLRSRAEVALQQEREAGSYRATLQGIEEESQRLGHIVEDLLTLARADAGERSVERRRVYLDDIALDACGAAQVVAQGRGVRLNVAQFEEAVVDGDPALLRQLTMILLDNAVKFTPCGRRVTVRVHTTAGRPQLVVEDQGIGIPAEQLPHVFERFYRGDPARSRGMAHDGGPDGAGLGLAIGRWIVETHGGEIDIVSHPGEGTRATVLFPPAGGLAGAAPEPRAEALSADARAQPRVQL